MGGGGEGRHPRVFFFFFNDSAVATLKHRRQAKKRRQWHSGPFVPVYHDSCSEAGCYNRAPARMAAASCSELLQMLAE